VFHGGFHFNDSVNFVLILFSILSRIYNGSKTCNVILTRGAYLKLLVTLKSFAFWSYLLITSFIVSFGLANTFFYSDSVAALAVPSHRTQHKQVISICPV